MYYVIFPTDSDMIHSRGPWKKHKYLSKVGDKYVYARDSAKIASASLKYRMMYGEKPEQTVARTTKTDKALSRASFELRNAPSIDQGGAIDSGVYATGQLLLWGVHGRKIARQKKVQKKLKESMNTSFSSALKIAGKRIVSNLLNKIKKKK